MGSIGWQELILIFIVALIVFGPKKLPEIGKTIGKGMAEFKKASNELKQTWEEEVRLDKEKEAMSQMINETSAQASEIIKDASISTEKKENS
jgi:sec-independent protein translocase protein TatA